jgi:periplasmic divalent cation tolerance protein
VSSELIVFVTTSSNDEADRIADALVSEQLAACVNIVSAIQSVYRWEGKIVSDQESLLIIKTTEERYSQLERRVKELHSYSTPEIIALKVERGSKGYLRWLSDSTRKDQNHEV